MVIKIDNREDWLKTRSVKGISGSGAGSVLGVNKYRSNVELWEIKTGKRKAPDISDKPAIQFGKFAKPLLRELFKQNYPDFTVDYDEFDMYVNDEYPFIFATLDGQLTAPDGSRGILKIKTTTIQNRVQWDEWDGKIPDSYYVQVLHQLTTTGWDFAILCAYIRYHVDGEVRVTIRHYRINRKDVESDIDFLIKEETKFWEQVQKNQLPALKLPEI